eukprot:scaffold26842_cov75-Phaeocystis_antarctica.AAC.3
MPFIAPRLLDGKVAPHPRPPCHPRRVLCWRLLRHGALGKLYRGLPTDGTESRSIARSPQQHCCANAAVGSGLPRARAPHTGAPCLRVARARTGQPTHAAVVATHAAEAVLRDGTALGGPCWEDSADTALEACSRRAVLLALGRRYLCVAEARVAPL